MISGHSSVSGESRRRIRFPIWHLGASNNFCLVAALPPRGTIRECRFSRQTVFARTEIWLAWRKAMVLVADVYRHTQTFPKSELYGLTAQLRRAAVSVPSNIAEGQGRASTGEFKQFLGHARGSLLELETQLQIAKGLEYLSSEACAILLEECSEVGRILNGLLASLPRTGR